MNTNDVIALNNIGSLSYRNVDEFAMFCNKDTCYFLHRLIYKNNLYHFVLARKLKDKYEIKILTSKSFQDKEYEVRTINLSEKVNDVTILDLIGNELLLIANENNQYYYQKVVF